jgi:hypothetical protein
LFNSHGYGRKDLTTMKLRSIALIALAATSLSACATRPTTEHAACVAPCAQEMSRMQFLEDVRNSGFEATRMQVIGADAAVAANAASEAEKSTTAKAQ